MKHSVKYFLWILLAAVTTFGCSKEGESEVHKVFIEPKTITDVNYGNDVAQRMDIYLPAGRSQATTQVLLIIHGGGWFAGDKKDMNDFASKFQNQMSNYAVVNMNYRLVTFAPVRYMLPPQTDDIRSAMDYIGKNAAELGVKQEFVVLGLSAGGHLAMLYSYKYDTERRVKAAVNIVGPSNLNDSYYLNIELYRWAMEHITNPSNLPTNMTAPVFGSPVTWVTKNAPPTISFYGTNDEYIPPSQHSALEDTLNNYKIPNQKHIYEGGHIQASYNQSDDIVAKTKQFVSTHVK